MPDRYAQRLAMAYRPSAPSYGGGGGSRLIDLIMAQGERQAEGHRASGELWGNALANIGQTIAGGIQQAGEEKRLKKRDAAWLGVLNDPKIMADPKALYTASTAIFGPDGPKMFQGVAGAMQLMQEKRDPVADQKAAVSTIDALRRMDPSARAVAWQPLGPAARRVFGEQVPEQYDDAFFEEVLIPYADSMKGPAKLIPVAQGTALVNEQTQQPVYTNPAAPPKPPAPPEPGSFGDYMTSTPERRKEIEAGRKAYQLADDRPRITVNTGGGPGAEDDNAAMLLQGGTADKLPIRARAAAVAAARESGGVDGTGFVPMSGQQQQKFADFMDLRNKAVRLRDLINDSEVAAKLGPIMGGITSKTKELPLFGASTKVKEAFDLFRDLSDTELRKRSGAAISPNEYERIVGFTVDPSKQPDSNLTNVTRMLEAIEANLGTMGATNLPAGGRRRAPKAQAAPVTGISPEDEALLKRYGY